MSATSPAASGPAGAQFEGQVGAYYLLTLLTGGQPRGLPATVIDRIELQRAAEGHPLDDVIVHAHDPRGVNKTLAIQVKRSMTFAPGDPQFKAVMGQIAETTRRSGFWDGSYELAVAIDRSSQKIENSYQEVLAWARRIGSAETFFDRLERRGSANDDMRRFVQTFAAHLKDAGATTERERIWELLARFQILPFDFAAVGSATLDLMRERAVAVLAVDQVSQADSLWSNLFEIALDTAAKGGDLTRAALIDELHKRSFRVAGLRSYSAARAALAEDSRHALNDIRDRVGDIVLTRYSRIEAVQEAMSLGRYVEIRGEAGVGKSGVLKNLAEQIAKESQIIVLSPDRITPRGWRHLAAALQFTGSARDLLVDLAADGGAVLFIDNLENFDAEEQKTAADLVREVSEIAGFAVVATARRGFVVEGESWLPADALDRLGRAPPVLIEELSESEIVELASAAPALAQLLDDNHPARIVARNLYRLSRLVSRGSADPTPRSEIDMAEQWWRTADGQTDDGLRDRARVLRFLASEQLDRRQPTDVSGQPSAAVMALIRSGTLRDLGNDRVTFTHDVLREWAVAMELHREPTSVSRLILTGSAPVSLARALELAARMTLERASDGQPWRALLNSVSAPTFHGSWRRAVILAAVRTEVAAIVLVRLEPLLFENEAVLLREVLRTMTAVEVERADSFWSRVGVDRAGILAGMVMPTGPAWQRVLLWTQAVGEGMPAPAIPDVANLYVTWCMGMLGIDPLTPSLLPWLYRWLREMEDSRDDKLAPSTSFVTMLESNQLSALEKLLRQTFVLFARRAPALAAEYLLSLAQRREGDWVVLDILKFRGTLAWAAPSELAKLTLSALLPREPRRRRHRRNSPMQGPFSHIDSQFLPGSPAQGPFYELLNASPAVGLELIRQLAQHAVAYYANGKPYEDDAIPILFAEGLRVFPWTQSYIWPRNDSHHAALSSALMALEAWAHERIERGEPFDLVLADVLDTGEQPAAYVLIAVDLILSHWPASQKAALPFLASPELLSIDRQRLAFDNVKFPDIFGTEALMKEPTGRVSLESLKKRRSRGLLLDSLLREYAVGESTGLREELTALVTAATVRLGKPAPGIHPSDPAFTAWRMLNTVNPVNWQPVQMKGPAGQLYDGFQYVEPAEEQRHLQPMRDALRDRQTDSAYDEGLAQLLDEPKRSSSSVAAQGITWARAKASSLPEDDFERRTRKQAILAAAMITARDGDPSLRAEHAAWIRETLVEGSRSEEDVGSALRRGLRYNSLAIVFAGFAYLLTKELTPPDLRPLLEVAAGGDPAVAQGLIASATHLLTIDARLPRAVLRCAFTGCIFRIRDWDAEDGEKVVEAEHAQRVAHTVDAEMAWLATRNSSEPDWPKFPDEPVRARRRFRVPGAWENEVQIESDEPPTERVNTQGAAIWLRAAASLGPDSAPWIEGTLRFYWAWTFRANGAGRAPRTDIDDAPREWSETFFDLLGRHMSGTTLLAEATPAICTLPDEPFFDTLATFLRSVDIVRIVDNSIDADSWKDIRAALAERMMSSTGWRRMRGTHSEGVEIHIGPAIAALFFNDYTSFGGPAKCFVLPPGISSIQPALPTLLRLASSAPSPVVATVLLNLLEVSPAPSHLTLALGSALAWLEVYPEDTAFWVTNDFGLRICRVIDRATASDRSLSDPVTRSQLDALLPALTRIGVSEAARLEAQFVP